MNFTEAQLETAFIELLGKAERPRNGLVKISVPFVSPTLEPKAEKAAPVAAFFFDPAEAVTKETILGTIIMKKEENQCKFVHTEFADRSRNNN